MGVLLFFIDGLGIGAKDKNNALYRFGLWKHLIGLNGLTSHKIIKTKNYIMIPTDPVMGVEGIPQSATGQTSILTGINAQQQIGAHVTGFPGEKLSALLLEHSLFKKLASLGLKVTSANAYSHQYFNFIKQNNRRVSATTLAIQAAGVPFRMLEDLMQNNAVFMDVNHKILRSRYGYYPLMPVSQAAKNLKNIILQNDFTLYEYFWTDFVGHKGTMKQKKEVLKTLNGFLKSLVLQLDLKTNTLIIISDHGNIEDHAKKRHTDNLVPTLIFSKNQQILQFFAKKIKNLADLTPSLIEAFKNKLF